MTEFTLLSCEIQDGIALVTIRRPAALNALNRQLLQEMEELFGNLRQHRETAGVIITGEGEKAFAAGADIGEISRLEPGAGQSFSLYGQSVFSLIEELGKPVVAAVNGFALGGGCELALACTLRTASENARFGQPEVKLGLIPGYGGTQRLPRLIGPGRALEIMLTGRMVDAREAMSIGLVNRITPAGQAPAAARELLAEILRQSPQAVRLVMEAVRRGSSLPLADGLQVEAELFGGCIGTGEMREGTGAFLEKRVPVFRTENGKE